MESLAEKNRKDAEAWFTIHGGAGALEVARRTVLWARV